MPFNIPSLEIGGLSTNAPLPSEAVSQMNQRIAEQEVATDSPTNRDNQRYQDIGSLFSGDNETKLKEESGAKFTSTIYKNELATSFSGADTKMAISFYGGEPIYIGEAQTVTYSLYRPVEPVYVLGDSRPNGFVRGQRTIAGSVIFTVFDRNILLNAFYNAYNKYEDLEIARKEYLTDELPPFDIHLTFMNEYGISAALVIYGCHIPSEGQVHSVEDMITENTIQYVARDMTLMRPGDIT